MSVLGVQRGLLVAAAAAAIGLALPVVNALRRDPIPYRFEGYEYMATTRFAVLSITNLGSCSVDFTGPAELRFADGWHPSWGEFVVVRTMPTIAGRKSGRWIFEVPPHGAKWKITCRLEKHHFLEAAAARLSKYWVSRWTWRLAQPRAAVFSSGWLGD